MPDDFPGKLRAWQSVARFSQKEAARVLGVNLWTYRGWLYGRHLPSDFVVNTIQTQLAQYHEVIRNVGEGQVEP